MIVASLPSLYCLCSFAVLPEKQGIYLLQHEELRFDFQAKRIGLAFDKIARYNGPILFGYQLASQRTLFI